MSIEQGRNEDGATAAPADLALVQLRLAPTAFAAYYVPLLISLAAVAFMARQLGQAPILAEREAAGRKLRDMRIPLALGLVFAVLAGGLQYRVLNGSDARQAKQVATDKLGPAYHYYTNSIAIGGGAKTRVSATVQAWNDNQVLQVPVQWEK